MTEAKSFDDQSQASATPRPRLRRELILAGICLILGLVVLPALIYLVGTQLLGVYGGGPHIGSFFGDFFRNLLSAAPRTWFIVFAPYVLLWMLRLVFWPWGGKKSTNTRENIALEAPAAQAQPARTAANKERREPFVAP
jgi:hypothetical protein